MNRNYMKIILPLGDGLCTWMQTEAMQRGTLFLASCLYRFAGFSINNETNEATFELVRDKP